MNRTNTNEGMTAPGEPEVKIAIVHSMNKLITTDCHAECIVIPSNSCNESNMMALDFKRFVNLRSLIIRDDCFENMHKVELIGLHMLEKVEIGRNSFTKHKNSWACERNHNFCLRDCEQLKELKIGCKSFSDFTVCEIANVPSLEVIEMGELNIRSDNFFFASLELKSDGDEMK